jgi:protoporphyrin/coproporphyrin ferrochelatase
MKTGILFTNLGSPNAPTPKAVKRFLAEFLSDPFVVQIPKLLWLPILYGIILNVRPKKTAKLYQKIWHDNGSPLTVITQAQYDALKVRLADMDIVVEWAMRYGEPSMEAALQNLKNAGCEQITVLPAYPQFSGPTTGSTRAHLNALLARMRWQPAVTFIDQYAGHDLYIGALAQSMEHYIEAHGMPAKFVLSYHGLPQINCQRGDPYFEQCQLTTRLLAERLGLRESDFMMTFQSRFGAQKWLEPYTNITLQQLPADGVTHVAVVCPGFAADCLETLEEIAITNRLLFLEAGGVRYDYIPALNTAPSHIDLFASLVREALQMTDDRGQKAEDAVPAFN